MTPYRPPKAPPSVHNPWRPAVPPLDPPPAPLHPRYGGNDPDDIDEADRRREQWPAGDFPHPGNGT